MKKRKIIRIAIIILIVAVGIYFLKGCSSKEEKEVKIVEVMRDTFEMIAAATGEVKAEISVDIKSRASGEVLEVNVEAGDEVKEGELLVKLDPEDEERTMRQTDAVFSSAQARLEQADAALKVAKSNYEEVLEKYNRRKGAYEKGLVSNEEYVNAKTALDVAALTVEQRSADVSSARADLKKAMLSIEEAKKRLRETIIRAPVSGTVLDVKIEKGSIVSSGITNVGGGTTLMTIADLSKLYVLAKVDEADIGRVRIGQKARIRVDAFQSKIFEGEISRITPLGVNEANVVTFDVKIEIVDEDVNLLYPGMRADVELVFQRIENALLLPIKAIERDKSGSSGGQFRGRRNGNYSNDENNESAPINDTDASNRRQRTFIGNVTLVDGEKRKVKIGASDGLRVVIIEGLNEGDKVIIPDAAADTAPKSIFSVGRPKR